MDRTSWESGGSGPQILQAGQNFLKSALNLVVQSHDVAAPSTSSSADAEEK